MAAMSPSNSRGSTLYWQHSTSPPADSPTPETHNFTQIFFFSEISNIFIYLYRSILPRIWAQYARIFSVKTHWNPFLYSSIPGSRSTDRVIGKTPAGLYLILQNPSTWSWTTILWVPLHSAVYDWSRSGERCEILSHHPRNQSWREGRFFSINILSFCHHHNTRVQRPDKLQELIFISTRWNIFQRRYPNDEMIPYCFSAWGPEK